jgi:hypothetical protein
MKISPSIADMGRFFHSSKALRPKWLIASRPHRDSLYLSDHTSKDRVEKRWKSIASANKTAYVWFICAGTSGYGRNVCTLPWSFA